MGTNKPSPERIYELSTCFWRSKTFLTAVELGVFSELSRGPLDAKGLTDRLGLDARGARDFFDALVALGLLQRDNAHYANAPDADYYLDRSKQSYIGGWPETLNERGYPSWGALSYALRTGRPHNEIKNREDLFTALYASSRRKKSYLRGMTGISMQTAKVLSRDFPWSDYESFADIGTAEGCLPVQLALRHRHLTGIGFDLPPVKSVFERYVKSFGLESRIRFVEGNFFKNRMPEADVLIMGRILHDWGYNMRRKLLKKAYYSLPVGGALIVYDMMIDNHRKRNTTALLMSLNMLLNTQDGSDYTSKECCVWMRNVGFRKVHSELLRGPDTMIIGTK
jgi:hypothetical protein